DEGDLVPYDAAAHETSESGQEESGGRYNNRVPRRLDNRLLREQNPYSGHFGDHDFDAVYPDPNHFLREHSTPFSDAEGNQWIIFSKDAGRWVPTIHGESRGLTIADIDETEYLFYRYDDQGPSWDYGGPEGAGGGVLGMPAECAGDFNGDGIVDAADLGLMLSAWSTAEMQYDIDGNGIVGGGDLGMLLVNWGECF
ncbi:MAG: hypothetical protein MK100_09785, partial [Phycisphaerales bacterium]|nr:hypothetical protein [Phycisphaerales bacterium]